MHTKQKFAALWHWLWHAQPDRNDEFARPLLRVLITLALVAVVVAVAGLVLWLALRWVFHMLGIT